MPSLNPPPRQQCSIFHRGASTCQSQPWPNMEVPFSDVSENDTGSIFGKSSRIKASAVLDYIINKHTFDLNLIMKLFGP